MADAELAIHQLVLRYCEAVNRRDAEAWGDTWAAQGEWRLQGSATVGRGEIVARWRDLVAELPFVLQIPAFGAVHVRRGSATGRWYVNELAQRRSGPSLLTGVYHDRYCREDGAWRFSQRRFEVLHRHTPELHGDLLWSASEPDALAETARHLDAASLASPPR